MRVDPAEALILNGILLALGSRPEIFVERRNVGRARNPKTGRRVQFGTPGEADVRVTGRSVSIAIEVKTASGRVSPKQRAWGRAFERVGVYVVARSVQDAVNAVDAALAGKR